MPKATNTKSRILEQAVRVGSLVGLEGLTLGRLADELALSKSGLYAHFGSKEELQLEVIRTAAQEFIEHVVQPALSRPRGEPRVVALFEGWLAWVSSDRRPGGCFFVAAATEMDDRAGPVRDELVRQQRAWLGALARAVQLAQDEGHYAPSLDAEQLAFELYGLLLSFHHQRRLLRDADAAARAREAFTAFRARARGERGDLPRYRELLKNIGFEDEFLLPSVSPPPAQGEAS